MLFGYLGLLLGTIGAGLAIAVANVLLPTVVRRNFKNHVAIVTGIYTTLLAVSASAAATLAVPSSALFGGWSQALAIWLVPTVLAILLWLPQVRVVQESEHQSVVGAAEERKAVYRSGVTWAIVIFFGLQSLGFYSILGWLPTALISIGSTPEAAGGYLGFASAIGIPFGLLVSAILKRFESQALWAAGTSFLTLCGFALYAIQMQQAYSATLIIWACVLLGLGMSATFPISLALISTRASSQAQTTELSTLAQGLGYLISAVGTFAMGLLANLTGAWFAGMALLVVLAAIQAVSGFFAGRPGHIPLSH
jgi:CP family cyanate transporter-like MFS transporter